MVVRERIRDLAREAGIKVYMGTDPCYLLFPETGWEGDETTGP